MAHISYAAHESAMSRAMRVIKWLVIALVATVILLFASNGLWLWYISGYDTESYELSTEGGGNASFIGNDGDIYNGESQSSQAH